MGDDDVRQAQVDHRDDGDLVITGLSNPDLSVEVNADTGEVKRLEDGTGIRVVGVKDMSEGATLHLGSCNW